MNPSSKPISTIEFVALLAMMISIVALSTDMMLPALDLIGRDLEVADPNDTQLVISSLFLGFAAGQLMAGPISDSFGRKPVVYVGYLVFVVGCLLSIFATSYSIMLVGRVLQGLGAACPRIITVAIVRDGYEGRAMARIMSIVMAVFIIVPAIAPALGQVVIVLFGWRSVFLALMIMAIVSVGWFAVRQPETLREDDRRTFSFKNIWSGIVEASQYRTAVGYTISVGFIFGAFLGYLSSAQQIFQTSFATGQLFPLYFAAAALAIGSASILNSRMVMRYGMRFLTLRALVFAILIAACFLLYLFMSDGMSPLWLFMVWLMGTFFCVGIMFGNFNALAMEPLGHMAGLGAALVGSLSTFIALPLGWTIGHYYDGGIMPLVAGFAVLGLCALAAMIWAQKGTAD